MIFVVKLLKLIVNTFVQGFGHMSVLFGMDFISFSCKHNRMTCFFDLLRLFDSWALLFKKCTLSYNRGSCGTAI